MASKNQIWWAVYAQVADPREDQAKEVISTHMAEGTAFDKVKNLRKENCNMVYWYERL